MAALTADRNTPARMVDMRQSPVAADVQIFAGAFLMRDASGNVTPGAVATGALGVGRAEEAVNNTGGSAGDETVKWRSGIFLARNHGADALEAGDEGAACYFVDDQTVAATDGTGTRSKAGIVDEVSAEGVWIRFDAALAAAL